MKKSRYIILLFAILAVIVCVKPIQAAVTLLYFRAEGSANQITIEWETASEIDMSGFYILVSDESTGTYEPISDLILATGDGISGAYYQFVDTYVIPGSTYYYKLEVLDRNQNSEFYGPISGYAGIETATPTATNAQALTGTSAVQSGTPPTRTATPGISTPTKTKVAALLPTSTRFALAATRTRTQPAVPTIAPPIISSPETVTPEILPSAIATKINVTNTLPETDVVKTTQSSPVPDNNTDIWGWMLVGIAGSLLLAGLGWLLLVIYRHKHNK